MRVQDLLPLRVGCERGKSEAPRGETRLKTPKERARTDKAIGWRKGRMWAQVKRKYIGTLYRWFVSERTSAPSSLRPQTVRTTFISVSLAFRLYRIGGNLNVRVTHTIQACVPV